MANFIAVQVMKLCRLNLWFNRFANREPKPCDSGHISAFDCDKLRR
jgi:hypothetical protein